MLAYVEGLLQGIPLEYWTESTTPAEVTFVEEFIGGVSHWQKANPYDRRHVPVTPP